jgi:hypothetical protein
MMVCLAAQSGCKTGSPAEPTPVVIHEHKTGDDAALKTMGITLINSQEQLAGLGSESLAQMQVDFASYSIVLVAVGEQPTGGFSAKVDGVQMGDGKVYVQATVSTPSGPATQALSYAYALAITDKVDGEVVPEVTSNAAQ